MHTLVYYKRIVPSSLHLVLNYFADQREIRNYCSRFEATACGMGKDFRYENDLRCDKASEIGVTRLATVRCPTGLAFDIERQTCDWKTNVKNCDQLESKRTSRLFP